MNSHDRTSALDQVSIRTPCPMKWAELRGNSQERYCEQCSLHVQNLSSMTRVRASEFLAESKASSERICVTFVRRPTSLIRM